MQLSHKTQATDTTKWYGSHRSWYPEEQTKKEARVGVWHWNMHYPWILGTVLSLWSKEFGAEPWYTACYKVNRTEAPYPRQSVRDLRASGVATYYCAVWISVVILLPMFDFSYYHSRVFRLTNLHYVQFGEKKSIFHYNQIGYVTAGF